MNKELFNDLKKSIRQGGKILKGNIKSCNKIQVERANQKLIKLKNFKTTYTPASHHPSADVTGM